MVVVVDTSVFVSALKSADGASRQVLRLCLLGQIAPVIGQKLFLEFLDVIQRPGLFARSIVTATERETLLYGFLAVCRWVEIYFIWRPNLPDEGDNHVVELALAGGAAAILTHNVSDFAGELRFPGVQILTPAQYLKSLR
jgi:putative PIN family toxin of toxin-antitoxin system